jgi:ABC transporter substrate binding protein (PQQ-dependent alcohol dehydrogenase system)
MMTRFSITLISLAILVAVGVAQAAGKKPVTAKPSPVSQPADAQKPVAGKSVALAYLQQLPATLPTRPYFDPYAADEGLQGARLGIKDNNTTGQFTRQSFSLTEVQVPADGDPREALKTLIASGIRFVLLDLPADRILELADLAEARDVLLMNVASPDDRLRAADCRRNLAHLIPSHAMRSDALAQYLAKKRWAKWLLVIGNTAEDKLYAAAMRQSARKFGAKIVAEKGWDHQFDDRRTPESEVPVFTQGEDYDVVVVIDQSGVFADVFPYRTWLPRPVTGDAGLVPTAWHRTHEAWGALQLQNRFHEQAARGMKERDYTAWLAVRSVGEAATRTNSTGFEDLRGFLFGDAFSLAGFKGVPLSFRAWDHQMRQPVLLAADRSLVAVAPVEGYLHPRNELDTLGYDQAESLCKF